MAWFNPNPVSFQPSKGVIDASGAFGRSLYDIYQNNVKNAQEQMKIDETERNNQFNNAIRAGEYEAQQRQNDINNKLNQDKFAYTKDKDERQFKFDNEKFAYTKNKDEREFNANQAYRNAVLAQNAKNHADTMELARQNATNMPTAEQLATAQGILNNKGFSAQIGIDDNVVKGYQEKGDVSGLVSYINGQHAAAKKQVEINGKTNQSMVDRYKTSEKLDSDMAQLATGISLLEQAKPLYNGRRSGFVDNGLNTMGKFFGADSTEMTNMRNYIASAGQALKSLADSGKISNQQYSALMATIPTDSEWNDSDFRAKWETTSYRLGEFLDNLSDTLAQNRTLKPEQAKMLSDMSARAKALSFSHKDSPSANKKWTKVGGGSGDDNNATQEANQRPPLDSFLTY